VLTGVAVCFLNVQILVAGEVKKTTYRGYLCSVFFTKYNSGNTINRIRWAGYVARTGKRRDAYRVLMEKPDGRRPLGRPGLRWDDNIKIDL
jgi:hypothetical protein